MKYIVYNTLSRTLFDSIPHYDLIKDYVDSYEADSRVDSSRTCSNSTNLELSDFNYEDLAQMHFHYSHKNNGKSIEQDGLKSGIGDNSKDIDDEEAIYFSVGIEGVLRNWDVWLKWRANRFNNPFAAGIKYSPELRESQPDKLYENQRSWVQYLKSKKYRENRMLLENVFRYERIELSRSDYYALTIVPGIHYPKQQYDAKKAMVQYFDYAKEIYGVGISTDLSNDNAEQWNRFTEPGKKTRIEPDNIWRLVVGGKNDALSILIYLYHRYMQHCQENGIAPAEFALLPKFIEYCE